MVCIGFREVLVGLDGFSHCGLQWCIVDGFTMIYTYIYILIWTISPMISSCFTATKEHQTSGHSMDMTL